MISTKIKDFTTSFPPHFDTWARRSRTKVVFQSWLQNLYWRTQMINNKPVATKENTPLLFHTRVYYILEFSSSQGRRGSMGTQNKFSFCKVHGDVQDCVCFWEKIERLRAPMFDDLFMYALTFHIILLKRNQYGLKYINMTVLVYKLCFKHYLRKAM